MYGANATPAAERPVPDYPNRRPRECAYPSILRARRVSARTHARENEPTMTTYTPTQVANARDQSTTIQGGGVQTAPTAATVVATATVVTPGLYEFVITYGLGAGTPVIGDVGNMNVKQGTAVKTTLPVTIGATPNAPVTLLLNCAANDAITVTAVANATSGVGYTATIVGRLLNPA